MRVAWNKGKKMPLVSQKMKGNVNGRGNKGRKMSPEWIEKLSQAKLGKPSPRKGSKLSPEVREKISISMRSSILFIEDTDDRKKIRRERIKIFGGYHSKSEWEKLKEHYNWSCLSCKRQEPHIKLSRDHIIPISIGGSDNIENIQPLCMSCNSQKGIKTIKY